MAKTTIKARIQEIEIDHNANKAIISVALTDGTNEWFKPIGISLIDKTIPFDDFKDRLAEMVKSDMQSDISLSEIRKRKGKQFNLMELDSK